MGEIGLSAGAYEDLRDIGDLVDEVTCAVRAGERAAVESQRLGVLLAKMRGEVPDSMAPLRLGSLLAGAGGALDEWVALGERLRERGVGASDLPRLERLAEVVDQATRAAAARLRGRGA
jgi:hypothetical protein